jgi:hypothetical protein
MKSLLAMLLFSSVSLADDPTDFVVDANVSFPDRKEIKVNVENLESREIRCTVKIEAKVKVNDTEFQQLVLGKKVNVIAGKTESFTLGKLRLEQVAPGAVFSNATVSSTACKYYDSSIIPGDCYITNARYKGMDGGCKDMTTGRVFSAISDEIMKFDSALRYCDELEEGGKDDWRLTTFDDLTEIAPGNIGRFVLALPASFSAPPSNSQGEDPIKLFARHSEKEAFVFNSDGDKQIDISFFWSESDSGACFFVNESAHAACVRGPKRN